MADGARVPVTLLTGFLGAGKTARLNATLRSAVGRVAVIENELGALGVDGALVANGHGDGVIELPNGCLCCSQEVDLVGALEALVRRHRLRRLERIVVETTGLADVAPVISLLRDATDPLAEDLYLDSTITVVDVTSLERWLGGGDGPIHSWASGFGAQEGLLGAGPAQMSAVRIFWRQVAFADQLILSKAEHRDVPAVLRSVNPLAEILSEPSIRPLPACRGQGFVLSRPLEEALRALPETWRGPQGAHLEGVACVTLKLEGKLFDEEALLKWAKQLLEATEVWRVKGLLYVQGHGPMLLQGAGDQVNLEPWEDALKVPFVVCIGAKGSIQTEDLEARLTSCATALQQVAG